MFTSEKTSCDIFSLNWPWMVPFLYWSTCAADSKKITVSGDKSQFAKGVHSLTVKGIEAICVGSKICKNVLIDQSNHQYHPRYIWPTVCKKMCIDNKRKRIPKVYSNMYNPEKLTAYGTQDKEKQSKNTTRYVLETSFWRFQDT